MKYLLILVLLCACEFKHDNSYRFGELVRIDHVENYTHCTGNIRNYIAFGYYQLDNIECPVHPDPYQWGKTHVDSKIMAESNFRLLWWQVSGILKDDPNYQPIVGSGIVPEIDACRVYKDDVRSFFKKVCNYKKFYRENGQWKLFSSQEEYGQLTSN